MAVLPIRIMGDPVLHAPAAAVEEITDDIRTLVADMFETMDAAPGVGLAAPQVGVPLRIYTYSYQDDDGSPVARRAHQPRAVDASASRPAPPTRTRSPRAACRSPASGSRSGGPTRCS